MSNMTLGSLFDGSGGFPLGGMLAGITPVWASEIEPFPIRVTTKRLPFMKHYGNVSEMDGGKGPLIQKDKSGTLATNNDQTLFVPTVYGICAKDSKWYRDKKKYENARCTA